MNRPVNLNDPTGHKPCGDGEKWECGTGKKQNPDADPYKPTKPVKDEPNDPPVTPEDELGITEPTTPDAWLEATDTETEVDETSDHYNDWYHGGKNDSLRTWDYITLTPTISLPGLGIFINASFPITLDRFGNIYLGGGVSVGPEGYALGGSGSFVGGWVLDGPPGEERTERFLSGGAINIGGGFIGGGAANISLADYGDMSGEGGIYLLTPQFSGTLYYSGMLYNNKSGNSIWR